MPPKNYKPNTSRNPELREIMQAHGLNALAVAYLVGRKPSTVRVWLNDHQGIPARALAALRAKTGGTGEAEAAPSA